MADKPAFVFPVRMELYRGWDTVQKRMLSHEELDAMEFSMSASGRPSHAHIIPMALTPVEDAFSERIYEGDICEMGVVVNKNIGLVKTRGWMGWDPGENHYTIFYEMDTPLLRQGAILKATGIRKVGNVFENPDLLTDEQNVPAEFIATKAPEAPKRARTVPKRPKPILSPCCGEKLTSEMIDDAKEERGFRIEHRCSKCSKACIINSNDRSGNRKAKGNT